MKLFISISLFLVFFTGNLKTQTFTNVAQTQHVRAVWWSGFNGGGISFVDYNNDGIDDIISSGGFEQGISLYKNTGTIFDSMAISGLNNFNETKSILWADFDNDGDMDVFMGCFNGSSKLFKNNGNGTYTDVTIQAGISTAVLRSTAASWGDYNRDGYLDLFVGNYSGFGGYFYLPNNLYKNNGDGTFTDVAFFAGVADTIKQPLAVAFIDYNNDGWPDIYVANDRRNGNSLFRNRGDGTFENVSVQSGANLEMDAMGLAVGDYDNDGDFDIYISNGEEGNGFLKNNGNGTFTEIAASLDLSINKICWGNAFFDYNNDGYLDLYICASGGNPNRLNELCRNNGNGTFTRMTGVGLNNDDFQSYGVGIGDFDNNGFLDMVCSNSGEPISLWKNSGNSNKWIKVKLQGTYSNRDAVGSVVEVYANGYRQLRYVGAGLSFCSQHSFIQHIGVGTASVIDSIAVKFPSGIRNSVTNVAPNQLITIIENGVIGISNNNTGIPSEYKLSQNYPNPFNPSTVIEYSVPKSSNVNIKLYNILGVEVAQLENTFRSAGNYSLTLSQNVSSMLASGVYYYQMIAGDFTDTKKMILIK